MCARNSLLHPAPHAEQSPLYPSAQGRWIGRTGWILAVRWRLLHGVTGTDLLTGLLSAAQSVVPGRHQPIGQNRERLATRRTDSASHPDPGAPVIVALTPPPSVADDRVVSATRTAPRQQLQRNHPGSVPRVGVVFRLRQCDKENHGWREGLPLTVPCESFDPLAGPSPSGKVSFKRNKKNTALRR